MNVASLLLMSAFLQCRALTPLSSAAERIDSDPPPMYLEELRLVEPATLKIYPASVNFATVPDGTRSSPHVAILTATGAEMTITAVDISGQVFSISGLPTMPFTIPARGSKTFSITFSPPSGSPGPALGTITFTTGLNKVSQTLTGTGTPNVTLKWKASATRNVTYKIYRCSISAAACVPSKPLNFGQAIAAQVTTTLYTDLCVHEGETYYYAVAAVDTSHTQSALSKVVKVVVPLARKQ